MSSDTEVESVGNVLRTYIVEIGGIKQDDLASTLGISRLSVNELLNDKRSITAAMALRLGHVLGTSPKFWLNLQRDVDLVVARKRYAGEIAALPVLREPQGEEDVVVEIDTLFAEAEG